MTRFTAELLDRPSERRFRRYNLPQQRRTALAALVLILVTNLASFGYHAATSDVRIPTATWLTQILTNVAGLALIVFLARVRRPRRIFQGVIVALVFLTVAIAVLIATGQQMAFRGSLLVVGGVVVIYLAAPLTLFAVTAFGLFYSAMTIPVWLLATDLTSAVDVPYVLAATALAHGLSFNEARRAQRERRVLFAQRELLHQRSNADALTGLFNRRAFDCRLQRAWTVWQATGRPLSVMMVDIDHFKQLNDSDGHAAGDRALRLVAGIVQLALPSGECDAGRYGGEEFACLLPGVDASQARAVAEDMVGRIRAAAIPMRGTTERGVLTISVGVAVAERGMESATDLLDAADQQLYAAKQSGRDRVAISAVTEPSTEPECAVTVLPANATGPAPATGLAPVQPLPQPASAGMTWLSSRSNDLAS